jgi:hypothetical protein
VKVVVDPQRVRKWTSRSSSDRTRGSPATPVATRSPVRPHARRPAHLLARAGVSGGQSGLRPPRVGAAPLTALQLTAHY